MGEREREYTQKAISTNWLLVINSFLKPLGEDVTNNDSEKITAHIN